MGEVKDDLSFKLSDEQYQALVKEFKGDMAVKTDAVKIFQKKQKKRTHTKVS